MEESFKCRGMNTLIQLYQDRIVLSSKALGLSNTYELPLKRIRSVIVERKSIIPFATLTIVAVVLMVIIRYNALWFLIDLAPGVSGFLSSVALLVAVISLVPVALRAFFVKVIITWDGDPTYFRVGLVSLPSGKRLAKRFQESSLWSEA